MEKFELDNDIPVLYVKADSFPDGIIEAHQKLHSLVPFSADRRYFGISRPEDGVIIYKAAAEEINQGEAKKLSLETFVIKEGQYISITIKDYTRDVQSIGKAFQKLTSQPGIDPNGYCIEWYLPSGKPGLPDKDVRCMIKLAD